MYAKDLINEFSPHYVLLPDRDDIDDKLNRSISDDKKAVYFNEKATLAPWKGVSIDIVNTDGQSFLYLTINSVNLLVCPARVNASYIPKEYRNCHIFIEGKIPENMNLISSNYAIMSNSENVANVKFNIREINANYAAKYAIDNMFKNKLIIIPPNMKLNKILVKMVPIKTLLYINSFIQEKNSNKKS